MGRMSRESNAKRAATREANARAKHEREKQQAVQRTMAAVETIGFCTAALEAHYGISTAEAERRLYRITEAYHERYDSEIEIFQAMTAEDDARQEAEWAAEDALAKAEEALRWSRLTPAEQAQEIEDKRREVFTKKVRDRIDDRIAEVSDQYLVEAFAEMVPTVQAAVKNRLADLGSRFAVVTVSKFTEDDGIEIEDDDNLTEDEIDQARMALRGLTGEMERETYRLRNRKVEAEEERIRPAIEGAVRQEMETEVAG